MQSLVNILRYEKTELNKIVKLQRDRINQLENNQQTKTDFFIGTQNVEELKKRYKELLKIYHPDNKMRK